MSVPFIVQCAKPLLTACIRVHTHALCLHILSYNCIHIHSYSTKHTHTHTRTHPCTSTHIYTHHAGPAGPMGTEVAADARAAAENWDQIWGSRGVAGLQRWD
jgi:hypothetical protein